MSEAPPTPEEASHPVRLVRPGDFRVETAERAVQRLAGKIGPRQATSPAYRRAAAWVADELGAMGYDVRRQRVAVPGGVSWGVPVHAGWSANVIATPPGFDSRRPHLVVGAHLDTVPQAPGGEDNASGVGVVLAIAEALATRRTRLPVALVTFGAEEPRGTSDADHHYGSRTYVASLGPAERRALRGMLSLDRVGVGTVVPVSSAGPSGTARREAVLEAGRRAGVPTDAQVNRSSDHWQFVLAGLPGLRIGSTPYAAYHSAADLPSVVSRAQLARTGRLVLAWLQ
jgi:aminopeptidase YwaD